MKGEQNGKIVSLVDEEFEPRSNDQNVMDDEPDRTDESSMANGEAYEPSTTDTKSARPGRLLRVLTLGGRLRPPRTTRLRIGVAAVLVLLLGSGAGGYFWWQSGDLPDDVAFRVGDKMVSVDELTKNMDTLRALYGVQPPEDERKLDSFRRDSAKALAVTLVLDNAARERNIVIADKRARDVLSRYIAEQIGEGPSAYEEFVRALGNAGISEKDVLTELQRQLTLRQLFDQVTKGQSVSGGEVRKAFDERRDELGTPERRKLRNIVVRTKAEADEVLADLKRGAAFDDVAKQRSLDSSTREDGGDLGEVSRDQLEDGYGDAAFTARADTVFGPVQNKFGWNVGKVEGVLDPVPAKFEESKDQLKETLLLEKAMQTWRDWIRERIKAAGVQYADQYRPADPEAPPGDAPGEGPVPGQAPAPAEPPR